MAVPTPRFTLRIDVERDSGIGAGEARVDDIGPTVAGEVGGELHPAVGREPVRRIRRRCQVDLPAAAVVGSEVEVRPGDDVEHAVVVEVVRTRAPAEIEVAEPLHAEAAGDLLLRARSQREILERDVLEPHFRGATHIQRDRPIPPGVVIGNPARAGVVDKRPDDVGVEEDLQIVPLSRVEPGVRRRYGQLRSGSAASASRSSPSSAWWHRRRRGGGRWRRRDADLAAARKTKRGPLQFAAAGVERDGVGRHIALVQREEDALQAAAVGLLGPQQDAGLATGGALERREESRVLIRAVEDEPTTGGTLGNAGDLSLFGAPVSITLRMPPRERRAPEPVIRAKRRPGAAHGRHHRDENNGRRERAGGKESATFQGRLLLQPH